MVSLQQSNVHVTYVTYFLPQLGNFTVVVAKSKAFPLLATTHLFLVKCYFIFVINSFSFIFLLILQYFTVLLLSAS